MRYPQVTGSGITDLRGPKILQAEASRSEGQAPKSANKAELNEPQHVAVLQACFLKRIPGAQSLKFRFLGFGDLGVRALEFRSLGIRVQGVVSGLGFTCWT